MKKTLKAPRVDTRWMDENEYDLANHHEVEANAVIALKLRRYMKTRGISQKAMAEKLSVMPQYVSKLLGGKANLGIGTALKYGAALGIELIRMPSITESPATVLPYGSSVVELVEQNARDRAIRAHCKACYIGELRMECGHRHPENCQSLIDFKKHYDNE